MDDQKKMSLQLQNDLCFMKLIKQAPVYTIMLLHEQLTDVLPLSEKYPVIRDIINKKFNTNFSSSFIQHQIEFFSSSDTFQPYLMCSVDVNQLILDYQTFTGYSIIFTRFQPMSRKCLICDNDDQLLPVYQLPTNFLFKEGVLEQCIILYAYCKHCKWSFYPNSYSQDSTKRQFVQRKSFTDASVFYFGGESVYSNRIFMMFSSALLSMYASFHGFVKFYNKSLIKKTSFTEKKLDEKNFQINWMMYEILKLLFLWSDRDIIEIPFSLYNTEEVNAFFNQHKNELYVHFVQYWSNNVVHRSPHCSNKCTDIIVIDGHQKTARTTCKFNNCYDNTIEELGPVLIGCPRSTSDDNSERL